MFHTNANAIGSSLPLSHVVADQGEIFALLEDSQTHGNAGPVKRIDTHGAVVFLVGSRLQAQARCALSVYGSVDNR